MSRLIPLHPMFEGSGHVPEGALAPGPNRTLTAEEVLGPPPRIE